MDKKYILMVFAFFVGYAFVSLVLTDKNADKEKRQEENSETNENNGNMWYDILEVSPNATLEEIKKAYINKISKYHPDKVASLGKEFQLLAEEKTKELNEAYEKAIKKRQ